MSKIAFAGCAHIHTPGFIRMILERNNMVETLKVWDHDASCAKEVAGKLGAQVVSSVDDICADDDIEGVVVCSETYRHENLVVDLANAGKHLFVEKPLGFGVDDARKMAAIIENSGVMFQTGYFMRGNPVNIFLREQIQTGNLGEITSVRFSNCHRGALEGWFDTEWQWMTDPKQAGCGAYGDLGTHGLDILMWWFGDKVEKVTAVIRPVVERYEGCDETGDGVIVFPEGITANLVAGWVNVANPVSAQISGTQGHALVVDGKLRFWSDKVEGADGSEWTKLPQGQDHAFRLYLDALEGKEVPLVGVREAAARNMVMDALYKSSECGGWIVPESL